MSKSAISAFMILTLVWIPSASNLAAQVNTSDWVVNLAPEECIMFLGWTGQLKVDENGSATEKWLAQKEIQNSVRAFREAVEVYLQENPAEQEEVNELARELPWLLMQQPFALYLSDLKMHLEQGLPQFDRVDMGAVIELGSNEKWMRDWIEKTVAAANKDSPNTFKKQLTEDFSYYAMEQDGLRLGFGIRNGKFLLAFGNNAFKNLLRNLNTGKSAWMTDVLKQASPERLAGIFHTNLSKVWDFAGQTTENALPTFLRLEELRSLSSVMDIRSESLVSTSMIACPEQTAGILSTIDMAPLKTEDIQEISANVDTAYAFRFSVPRLWDLIKQGADEFGSTFYESLISEIEGETGLDFEKDVLSCFEGTFFSFATIDLMNPTGSTMFAAKISHPDLFRKHLERINDAIDDEIVYQGQGSFTQFETSGVDVYVVQTNNMDICWCLVDDKLLMALDRSAIRTHLRKRKRNSNALVAQQEIREYFGGGIASGKQPLAITVADFRRVIQVVLPSLNLALGNRTPDPDFPFSMRDLPPTEILINGVKANTSAVYRNEYGFKLIEQHILPGNSSLAFSGIGVGLMLPAVQAARHAARRTTSANNIRQLLLSNLIYEEAHGSFPTAYTSDASGQKLLSWRVHILPYMDEKELFDQFHLNEPWDSPHNKTLIAKMPVIYSNPALPLEKGMTSYLAVTGEHAVLAPPTSASENGEMTKGVTIDKVDDGMSNTLMIVDANLENTVIWTKPDDFDPGQHTDLRGILTGTWARNLIMGGRADGSITYLDELIADETLRQMMHKSDGEPVR